MCIYCLLLQRHLYLFIYISFQSYNKNFLTNSLHELHWNVWNCNKNVLSGVTYLAYMSLWRFLHSATRVNAHISWLTRSILSLGPSGHPNPTKASQVFLFFFWTENVSITHVCKLTLQVLPMFICKTLPDSLICPAATLLNEISYTRVEIVAHFGVTLRVNDISDISICSAIDDSVTRNISLSLVHISDISLLLITNSLNICIFM